MGDQDDQLVNEFLRYCVSNIARLQDVHGETVGWLSRELGGRFVGKVRSFLFEVESKACKSMLLVAFDQEQLELYVGVDVDSVGGVFPVTLFLKNNRQVDPTVSLERQISHITLSDKNTMKELTFLVNNDLLHAIDLMDKENFPYGRPGNSSDGGSDLRDVEFSLQNVDGALMVPDLISESHHLVKDAVNRGANKDNYSEFIRPEELRDPLFLNALQSTANDWLRNVQRSCKVDASFRPNSAFDEVRYWSRLREKLSFIAGQLQSQEIQITMSILISSKRWHMVAGFSSDSGLDNRLETVREFEHFLSSIPLDALKSSANLRDVEDELDSVAAALKKFRFTQYPAERFASFLEQVSQEVQDSILAIAPNLFSTPYASFSDHKMDILKTIDRWDEIFEESKIHLREALRRSGGSGTLATSLKPRTSKLRESVNDLAAFRRRHQLFSETLRVIEYVDYTKDLDYLYEPIKTLQNSHLVKSTDSQTLYNKRLALIEKKLITLWNDELIKKRSSTDIIDQYSSFAPLMSTCPRLSSVMKKCQKGLLSSVRRDFITFQDKINQSDQVQQALMLKGLSSVSATLLERSQARIRAQHLYRRCEGLLGPHWEKTPEGKPLSLTFKEVMQRTDLDGIFKRWKSEIIGLDTDELCSPILKIFRNSNQTLELSVNFETVNANILGEVKTFTFLGFEVPNRIVRLADRYEHARLSALNTVEQVQSFLSVVCEIDSHSFTQFLLERYITDVWGLISRAATTPWSSFEGAITITNSRSTMSSVFDELEKAVSTLMTKFYEFDTIEAQLSHLLYELSRSSCEIEDLTRIILSIQCTVTQVESLQPHGIQDVVRLLNHSIDTILIKQLQHQLQNVTREALSVMVSFERGRFNFSPSVKDLKANLIRAVESITMKTTGIPQIYLESSAVDGIKYFTLTNSLDNDVLRTFEQIKIKCECAVARIERLKKIELLWCVQASEIEQRIGSDMTTCLNLLKGLIESRTELELLNNENDNVLVLRFNSFDSLSWVNQELIHWEKTLGSLLMELYEKEADDFDQNLKLDLKELEKRLTSDLSLKMVCSLLEDRERVKSSCSMRNQLLESFSACEVLFLKLHLDFSCNHIFLDHLENGEGALEKSLKEVDLFFECNRRTIIQLLDAEETFVFERSESIFNEWQVQKQRLTKMKRIDAANSIRSIRRKSNTISEDMQRLCYCSKILARPFTPNERLMGALDELRQFETMHDKLDSLQNSLNSLFQRAWGQIEVKDIIEELDKKKHEIRGVSNLTYESPDLLEMSEQIIELEGVLGLLKDLKCSALKPRHWQEMFRKVCAYEPAESIIESQSFSLAEVLKLSLKNNRKTVRDIIDSALREVDFRESLDRMKLFWNKAQCQYFQHKGGLNLVSEWRNIQQACFDDLEELTAMKNSISYGCFEQECLEMDSKLAAFSPILSDWIDLQFNWLDLFGILGNESSLQGFLPSESSKFHQITLDFHDMLSKIFRLPSVLDVLHIPEVDSIFKRMLNAVKLIKLSLNGFLEHQRELFPRFYFLGNSDLLRLLGAGSDLSQVSRYLVKMFGSISGLNVDEDLIKGVYSAEGELLLLSHPIAINVHTGPQEWLSALDLEVRHTLVSNTDLCLASISDRNTFLDNVDFHVFQVVLLSWQILFTAEVDKSIATGNLSGLQKYMEDQIIHLSRRLPQTKVLHERQKLRSLLIEIMHSTKIVTELLEATTTTQVSALWYKAQKFYYVKGENYSKTKICLKIWTNTITYSFNYIGVPERLIYTPTMIEAFSALVEALNQGFGGCLSGPAGTGKTETIKALSQNLGKMVLVFNCDESFDYLAMSRLVTGVVRIGAWGCFDELNRLDENVLTSVAELVKTAQDAISIKSLEMKVMGKFISLNPDTGLFITLNPGYEGRSYLPEVLKRQFREYSMTKTEMTLISQVMLCVLGFEDATVLAQKLVGFLVFLRDTCSSRKHYDFGLRLIKKVLQNCAELAKNVENKISETCLLHRSLGQIILPGFDAHDEALYHGKIRDFFSESRSEASDRTFAANLSEACESESMIPSEKFVKTCEQLYHMQKSQQAIIIMGEAGVGKSAVWKTTVRAITKIDGSDNVIHVIDLKAMEKKSLYGEMNKATLEWKDGIITSILRSANDITEPPEMTRVWIVLDSDLDPDYIETLNSALDDNKMLTLPNGERIKISDRIRLILEVADLEHTTLATITRCAILWTSTPLYSPDQQLKGVLAKQAKKIKRYYGISSILVGRFQSAVEQVLSKSNIESLITVTKSLKHIMGFEPSRLVPMVTSLLSNDIARKRKSLEVMSESEQMKFLICKLYESLENVMLGDVSAVDREKANAYVLSLFSRDYTSFSEISYLEPAPALKGRPRYTSTNDLQGKVKKLNSFPRQSTVVPTAETIRYESCISAFLQIQQPMILCGPPGSGKTMLISNILSRMKDIQLVSMNFSKDTSVSHLFRALNRHMKYVDGPKGMTLCPKDSTKSIVLFCDEINLPKPDKYGTQSVILFLRLLIEKKGFWRQHDNKWVSVERFLVIGACNPSTDFGRTHLSARFLRHAVILFIDYPGPDALFTIYQSLLSASFPSVPSADLAKICEASTSLYYQCQATFTADIHSHYAFSPRELTRWVRSFSSTVNDSNTTQSSLLRVWAHEAWRIFADRLVTEEDRIKFEALLTKTIKTYFPRQIEKLGDTSRLLFSSWLSSDYREVDKAEVLSFLIDKARLFSDEKGYELLFIHDELLQHVLRIDRNLNQVQGHFMLVGAGRIGKTTMVEFVCWLNEIQFLRPSIHRNYGITEFDCFLRDILFKCTVGEQRVCLVINESNIQEAAFLERMNTLLANSDLPDLFQEEHYDILLSLLKQKCTSLHFSDFTEEDLYDWFTQQISKNLHVVFTLSDSSSQVGSQILSSPALLNRCVLDWIGSWSTSTLKQLVQRSLEFTFESVSSLPESCTDSLSAGNAHQTKITDVFLLFHTEFGVNQNGHISPSLIIDAVSLFRRLMLQKSTEMGRDHHFLNNGLKKLEEAVTSFETLRSSLKKDEAELQIKEAEARKMLDILIFEQKKAEEKHDTTQHIQESLLRREDEARQRRKLVKLDLESLEPIMQAAQLGVKSIKKHHLTEIRSMTNPPSMVKITLEAVCSLLGHESSQWRSIQQYVRSDQFIPNILHFDVEVGLSKKVRISIKERFLSLPKLSLETVQRASKACGPLFQWVSAQIRFGDILEKVEPTRREAKRLEDDAAMIREELLAAEVLSNELKDNIKHLKDDYMRIFEDMERLRHNMKIIQRKIDRSHSLIKSLMKERSRWTHSIDDFRRKARMVEGNCLLSSLVCTYFGNLDEKKRQTFFHTITSYVRNNKIDFASDYDFVSEIMTIENQHKWLSYGLMHKTFFMENFAMILASEKVPFIIDPNSKVPKVLSKRYGNEMQTISFLESGFKKKLLNAVKFGSVLLIKDAEHYDPVISNLVVRVTRSSDLIRTVLIGDVDVSIPSHFGLFLHSTDDKKALPEFLKWRVQVVNFSISGGTIEKQVLRTVLESEAPDIYQDSKKSTELNYTYEMRLRSLESQMLTNLNESKGSVLESDELLATLEKIKQEANEVSIKLDANREVMKRISNRSALYAKFASYCASVYTVLERFRQMHWFYDISLWHYFCCLEEIYASCQRISGLEEKDRLEAFVSVAFKKFYSSFSAYLSESDRRKLAIILSLMQQDGASLELLLERLQALSALPEGKQNNESESTLPGTATATTNFPREGENVAAINWAEKGFSHRISIEQLFLSGVRKSILIATDKDSNCSNEVIRLAKLHSRNLSIITLGSIESTSYAEEQFRRCATEGSWLLLQNIQMSMPWVESFLTKQIGQQVENMGIWEKDFKIFMSCNFMGEALPPVLLQQSYKLVVEETPTVLQEVKTLWQHLRTDSKEHTQLLMACKFLLTWFHAALQAHSRLAPIGMKKRYDFNESDLQSGIAFITKTVDIDAKVRDGIDLVCEKIQFCIGRIIYGGKVDEDEDLTTVQDVCHKLFQPAAIECLMGVNDTYHLLPGVTLPKGPVDVEALADFLDQVCEPVDYHTSWLGLPEDVIRLHQFKTFQETLKGAINVLQ